MRSAAQFYLETEKSIIQNLLESPFIHADETPINIWGAKQYAWVFTNGKYVIFKLTETKSVIRDSYISGHGHTNIARLRVLPVCQCCGLI